MVMSKASRASAGLWAAAAVLACAAAPSPATAAEQNARGPGFPRPGIFRHASAGAEGEARTIGYRRLRLLMSGTLPSAIPGPRSDRATGSRLRRHQPSRGPAATTAARTPIRSTAPVPIPIDGIVDPVAAGMARTAIPAGLWSQASSTLQKRPPGRHTCRIQASRTGGNRGMDYTITPLTPHTGAEVRGLDLNAGDRRRNPMRR